MSNSSKTIERVILEMGLAFAGITAGVEIHSYQKIDKCQQSLAVVDHLINPSAYQVFF